MAFFWRHLGQISAFNWLTWKSCFKYAPESRCGAYEGGVCLVFVMIWKKWKSVKSNNFIKTIYLKIFKKFLHSYLHKAIVCILIASLRLKISAARSNWILTKSERGSTKLLNSNGTLSSSLLFEWKFHSLVLLLSLKRNYFLILFYFWTI